MTLFATLKEWVSEVKIYECKKKPIYPDEEIL